MPENTIRIWCHTHPGNSASPSGTDWETFVERFEQTDFGVMFILAKQGAVTANLAIKVNGELAAVEMKTLIDWGNGILANQWKEVIAEKVTPIVYAPIKPAYSKNKNGSTYHPYGAGGGYNDGYGDDYWLYGEQAYGDAPTLQVAMTTAAFKSGSVIAKVHLATPDNMLEVNAMAAKADTIYYVRPYEAYCYCLGYFDMIFENIPPEDYMKYLGADSWLGFVDLLNQEYWLLPTIVDVDEDTKKIEKGGKK